MNNSNGEALLARVKAGDLVTIRWYDGGTRTGRYYVTPDGESRLSAPGIVSARVTADNIVSIAPALRAGG